MSALPPAVPRPARPVARRVAWRLTEALFWGATMLLSAQIAANSWPYFVSDEPFDFLIEKGRLADDPIWYAAFVHHIAGALVCLLSGPLLLSRRALARSVALHRVLGWAYVIGVLVIGGPTGLYLALFAKGGLASQVGFALAGVAWLATTWLGLVAVRRRRLAAHVTWMARSYALAWSAISFRVIQIALYALGVGATPNYVASLWLSLVLSVVLGEFGARHLRRRAVPAALSLGGPR